jgi:hypothetical protein
MCKIINTTAEHTERSFGKNPTSWFVPVCPLGSVQTILETKIISRLDPGGFNALARVKSIESHHKILTNSPGQSALPKYYL